MEEGLDDFKSRKTCHEIVCSIYDKEAEFVASQQYSCLSKNNVVKTPFGIARGTEEIPHDFTLRVRDGQSLLREGESVSRNITSR